MPEDTPPSETVTDRSLAEAVQPEPDTAPKRPKRTKAKAKRPMTPAQKAALEKAQAARRGSGKKAGGGMTSAQLRKALAEAVRSAAGALTVAGVMVDPRLIYDGQIIAGKADELAAELVELADKNPAVHAALVTLVKGSQWARLGGLVVSIVVPIAANHGLIPIEAVGLVPGVEAPPPRPQPTQPTEDGRGDVPGA